MEKNEETPGVSEAKKRRVLLTEAQKLDNKRKAQEKWRKKSKAQQTTTKLKKQRESNCQSQRRSRETKTVEQRKQCREQNRISHSQSRENENDDVRQQRLERDRISHSQSRENENDGVRQLRLERDRISHSQSRENENDGVRQLRLETDRISHSQSREIENDGVRQLRLERDRISHSQSRENENDGVRQLRRELDRVSHSQITLNENNEQRLHRQQRNRVSHSQRYRQKRDAEKSPFVARNPVESNLQELNFGRMEKLCTNCSALHFAKETFSSCCGSGKISLRALRPYPEPLLTWLKGENDDVKHFRSHSRKYNGAFAFASFGYNSSDIPGRGPPVFKIHGQVYHRTATTVSAETPTSSNDTTNNNNKKNKYAQLYILDPDYATETRAAHPANDGCKLEVMTQIETLLRQVNPYANAYSMMKEVAERHDGEHLEMWLVKDVRYDKRRYNLPVEKNEVAAVFTKSDGNEDFINRDICVYPKQAQAQYCLQNIRIDNPNLDPMTYPLLFPFGEQGWNYDLRHNNKKISFRAFYSYHLQERADIFNPILHCSKLTQQYIVDAYLKVEGDRLNFVRSNQKELRVESYLGLMDYIDHQAEDQHLKPGKMVILPSSFTGGKRAMREGYQDAMTIVAAFGKPDLFITFTCNAKWEEITSNLLPFETAIDRPDLTARVFNLKLKEFMKDMTQHDIFGKVLAYQSVIEFQKRGLPHCHMLFILADQDKIKEPEVVDTVVCAEIPDKEKDPELYEIVSTAMVHGPCGPFNRKCVCMEPDPDGKLCCNKGFPKDSANETILHDNGYPEYRRRCDGRTVVIKGNVLDNRWIVPYNPYLCRKYNAHINVEVCSSIKSVKYIYKYIYKGHDAAVVKVNPKDNSYNWDEVQAYIDTRYLAAPEAMWRLRSLPMQDRSHAIYRLPVHLPCEQNVMFSFTDSMDEQESITEALRQAERKGTKLTQWFRLNQNDLAARRYTYREIPEHYVYDTKNYWTARKRGGDKILPRLYSVSPRNMELYSLRLLLLNVKGATCYEDLRTVNGRLFSTFQQAAKELQLLEDDSHWGKALEEASVFSMPFQLRVLFGSICEFGFPAEPKELFSTFKDNMIEDYLRQHNDEELALNSCLRHLEEYFAQFGHSCVYFGLPAPKDVVDVNIFNFNVEEEQSEHERLHPLLNEGQRAAYDEILGAVNGDSRTKCFFLSGPGGSGKTFLYRLCIATLYSRRQRVKSVAPTGLAATLLKDGQTVHSGFGLPLNLNSTSVSKIRQGSKEWKVLKDTKLIIWDEISMCTKDMFECVDRSLKDLLGNNEPFGGIPIVVGGDFRQQAPVLKRAGRLKIIEACIKKSQLWSHFKELPLTVNMRVNQDEKEFTDWLLQIGSGMNEESSRSEFVAVQDELLSSDIISSVYNEISTLTRDELASRAVLCPLNQDTLSINETILTMLPGEITTFSSIDTVQDAETEEEKELYPVEFLNSITPMGLPPHKLNLKQGCCVMLLRNMNPKQGLCNGTRLIVEHLNPNVLDCTVFSGSHKGSRALIPRICLDTSEADVPFKLRRKQFPFRLAYSMTITKSQGQTFERIGLFLPKPVFAHGQLYTALSRVKSKNGLAIQITPGDSQGKIFLDDENVYTYNCVFDEIL